MLGEVLNTNTNRLSCFLRLLVVVMGGGGGGWRTNLVGATNFKNFPQVVVASLSICHQQSTKMCAEEYAKKKNLQARKLRIFSRFFTQTSFPPCYFLDFHFFIQPLRYDNNLYTQTFKSLYTVWPFKSLIPVKLKIFSAFRRKLSNFYVFFPSLFRCILILFPFLYANEGNHAKQKLDRITACSHNFIFRDERTRNKLFCH